MTLTIAEVARAVGKSDNYVRQHIRRKHLVVQKESRRVFVALDEAARWASDRRLPFTPPARAAAMTGEQEGRTARMTVLIFTTPDSGDSKHRNLFTLLRHRRRESLGPWTTVSDGTWAHADPGHGLRLYSLDASLDHCNSLIERILNSGTLTIDGIDVVYTLGPVPRCHWAYRDPGRISDASVSSPFSRHSAEITEYWSFDKNAGNSWQEVIDALSDKSPRPPFSRLGFPLHQRSDRLGNLMIAGALDAVTCELDAHHDQTLRLDVQGDKLDAGLYRATVWASQSEDVVLRREVLVTSTPILIKLSSDVDRIGFSVYRTEDGQCVDHMQVHLIVSISGRMNILDQPAIIIKDRQARPIQTVTPAATTIGFSVGDDNSSADLNSQIRREWLDRQFQERERRARKDGNLVRFAPTESDHAARHFISLLNIHSDDRMPIYIADPYFMVHSARDEVARLLRQIFAATIHHPLRILCGLITDEHTPPWWSTYPHIITKHVSVRAFRREVDRSGCSNCYLPGFHDRYLITPECETLFTHSFNGWHKDGVTFSRNAYGVYRAEAEKLWSMGIDDVQVKEIS